MHQFYWGAICGVFGVQLGELLYVLITGHR